MRTSPPRLVGAETFFGREAELAVLDRAWGDRACGIVELVAEGGAGKTSLAAEWRSRRIAEARERKQDLELFEWSFYSQGTRDHGGASADHFIRAALVFFGDATMAESTAPQENKGERIAALVEARGAVLLLDGLEPLQRQDGTLREPGVASLLRGLGSGCPGLCVVTTRVKVAALDGCSRRAVIRKELVRLDEESGSALLQHLLEDGDRPRKVTSEAAERRAIWEEVQGHALTLLLTGSYIRHSLGDVRRWREIDFRRADDEVLGGHASRVMDAYVRWLSGEAEVPRANAPGMSRSASRVTIEGEKLLAVLRILGFFDRGADPGCVAKLREAPPIPGVTEALVGLSPEGWERLISTLEQMRLLGRSRFEAVEFSGYDEETARAAGKWGVPEDKPALRSGPVVGGDMIEAHPLVREYFARILQAESPAGWREGHGRLFEYLCSSVPYWPEGTNGLQPLYQAVVHGCAAGRTVEACRGVYLDRIFRGARLYSTQQLGAISADLVATACLFESCWDRPSMALEQAVQAWVLGQAAFRLRAMGRLNEALEPMRASLDRDVECGSWGNAAFTRSVVAL